MGQQCIGSGTDLDKATSLKECCTKQGAELWCPENQPLGWMDDSNPRQCGQRNSKNQLAVTEQLCKQTQCIFKSGKNTRIYKWSLTEDQCCGKGGDLYCPNGSMYNLDACKEGTNGSVSCKQDGGDVNLNT